MVLWYCGTVVVFVLVRVCLVLVLDRVLSRVRTRVLGWPGQHSSVWPRPGWPVEESEGSNLAVTPLRGYSNG